GRGRGGRAGWRDASTLKRKPARSGPQVSEPAPPPGDPGQPAAGGHQDPAALSPDAPRPARRPRSLLLAGLALLAIAGVLPPWSPPIRSGRRPPGSTAGG